MPEMDAARRAWWLSTRYLTNRWRPCLIGGDEFGNRTLAVRLPGGMLIVALNVPLRTVLWDTEL